MDLSNQILTNCFTKSSALAALSDIEDQVRSRKVSQQDYLAAKKEIWAIEPLHLELAIELTADQLKEMVTKLRKDYTKNFLVEITTNPNLIGGAKVSYKGVLKDYTLYGNRLRQSS